MDPDPAEEMTLAARVAAGDEQALTELVERFGDPLFAFIYHSLDGAREEAQDVWQETLVASLRALPAYRGQSRLFSWLCSIARHKIADFYRAQGRRAEHLHLLPAEDLLNLIDSQPLPEELLDQRATCLRVVEALGQLPLDYRTALVARYADGHSVQDVAQLLGKSYKAAESILSRAKEAFRTAISSQVENEL